MIEWKNTDPRIDIYKRDNIIILRPGNVIGTGYVDTKEGWFIFTSFEDHKSIDEWDQDWRWIRMPK